jgi:hypothetical protein
MKGQRQESYRFGRRPGEQDPRPLSWNQDRVEKLATGRTNHTTTSSHATTVPTSSAPTKRNQVQAQTTATTTNKYVSNKLTLTKHIFTVGTWNVRTLWATGKLELLRNEMKRYRYDVIGISEVRWTGKGETANGDFIWSGENNVHNRGVAMLLSTRARKALVVYNPINSRLITARFTATPFNTTIINVYAPISDASGEDMEAFYDDLEHAITKTSKKDILIITGDWNAKVGDNNAGWESAMGKHGYGTKNERGEQLLEFATSHNLFICNRKFQQKPNRKWTWESPDGIHTYMIDLIIIQQRWKSSVINCRTFQGADINSDHSLVLCNIKLKLKNLLNNPKQNRRLDTRQLNDQITRKSYQIQLENQLNNIQANSNIDEHALQIEQAIKEALRLIKNEKQNKQKTCRRPTMKNTRISAIK